MTTTPAMPELPEPDRTMWQHGKQIDHYTADQMRAYALATLQAQPAEVSDEVLDQIDVDASADANQNPHGTLYHWRKAYLRSFARAILALRPQAVPMAEWQPLDAARLNTEEFDGAYWLAMKNGEVAVGEYEWRQGWNPHGFNLIDGGRVGASEITHTATFVRPAHPAHGTAAHQATKEPSK